MTNIPNDACRVAFEADHQMLRLEKTRTGKYADINTHIRWVNWQRAWQAALSRPTPPHDAVDDLKAEILLLNATVSHWKGLYEAALARPVSPQVVGVNQVVEAWMIEAKEQVAIMRTYQASHTIEKAMAIIEDLDAQVGMERSLRIQAHENQLWLENELKNLKASSEGAK